MSGDWAWKQAVGQCLILNFYNWLNT
jgi:hypothetical protein